MKILEVKTLAIPEIKVIRFARFLDARGYFCEPFRQSDFLEHPDLSFFKGAPFVQTNESFSKAGVIRGLHFQWQPYMGKLVRTVRGRMVDIILDIRKNSPTAGKIIMYSMPAPAERDYNEWIWLPPGFAHGNFYTEETTIEYMCTGEYSPTSEAGISPLAEDLDWSLCDANLRQEFQQLISSNLLISDKDKTAPNFTAWMADALSDNFIYGTL